METITKLQEQLFNSYNDGNIDGEKLVHGLKYVKDMHGHMVQLRKSMIDSIDIYIDGLGNTEAHTLENVTNMYKELLGKHNELKVLLTVPTTILGTRDSVDEDYRDYDEDYGDEDYEEGWDAIYVDA